MKKKKERNCYLKESHKKYVTGRAYRALCAEAAIQLL